MLTRKFCMKNIPLASLEFLKESYDKKEKHRMNIIEHLIYRAKIPKIIESVNPKMYIKQGLMGINRRKDMSSPGGGSFASTTNYSSNLKIRASGLRSLAEKISCAKN